MFSFFYTEKIANYVLENNDLYKEIVLNMEDYAVASVNAVIEGDYIIPGLTGKVVDIKNSYYNMKDIETFNSYYLMYDITYPEVSLDSNIDKVINKGNPLKNSVAFILEYDQEIIDYFVSHNYEASVIVTMNNFDKNCKLEQINGEVAKFDDIESLINKYSTNANVCYVTNNNLDVCKDKGKYLVQATKLINNSSIIDIKNNVSSGDIYYINKNTDVKSIQLIINSIIYKDLDIVKISELIKEERS